jgi:hypothetical protein
MRGSEAETPSRINSTMARAACPLPGGCRNHSLRRQHRPAPVRVRERLHTSRHASLTAISHRTYNAVAGTSLAAITLGGDPGEELNDCPGGRRPCGDKARRRSLAVPRPRMAGAHVGVVATVWRQRKSSEQSSSRSRPRRSSVQCAAPRQTFSAPVPVRTPEQPMKQRSPTQACSPPMAA